MAVVQTWFSQDLQKAVKVNYIDGNLFTHNGNGNSIGVRVYDDGEPVTLTGTVSGYVITSDGSTVPCVGARSGNEATITIPPAAYQPGNAFITIFLTDGSTVTTLCAAQTTVLQARTGSQVSPGSVVTDWTQTINAAMQSVEDATENLGGIIATPYASLTYPVPLGKYTYYNSNLYRCVSPIETSEESTAAHWTQVKLGDDVSALKSAIDYVFDSLSDVVREVSVNEVITANKYIYYHMYFKKDNVYRITVNLVSVDLKNAGIRLYASPVGQYAQGEEIGRYAYTKTGDVIQAYYVPNSDYSDLCILVAGNSGTQQIDIRVEHLAYEAVNGINDAEEMFTYYSHTKNLFDIAQATASRYVDNATGELVNSGDYTASGFIEVEPNENYVISNTTTTSASGMRFACYDDNGDFIENSGGQGTNSITTPATAKYVRFSFLSNRNNVMLEKGSTATAYIPFGVQFSGVMVSIGSVLFDTITGQNVVSNKGTFGTGTGIVRGADFSPAIADYTSSDGATFADGKWSIGARQSIQTSVPVTEGKTYFIQWELDSDSIVYSAHEPDLFTVSLGDQSIGVFYAPDSTNRASLVASETGNVVLKLQMAETASGAITRVRITEFTQLCAEAMDINGTIVRAYNDNVAVGGGQEKSASNGNTAFGKGAQSELNAGQNNSAFGYQAQRDLTAGAYNTACGNRAQMRLTTGMYNVGVGQLAQFYLTTGCWNNAMGNEAQRDLTTGCDNVSLGRRSHNSLTTGSGNTAVGSQSGYINGDDDGTYNRTTTGSYQTTIGFNATQKSANMEQFDYVTAIGAFARAGEKATAIGAKAKAKGTGSVAIGMDSDGNGAQANSNNQIVVGTANHSIILAGHKINFNQDGSVTWESV